MQRVFCSKEEVSVAAAALNNNNKKRVCCIASLSRPTTVKSSLQSRPVQTPPPWLPSASCYVLLSLRGQGSLVTFCIGMHCLPLSVSKPFLLKFTAHYMVNRLRFGHC